MQNPAAVVEKTEVRCPVMNLLLDVKVDLAITLVRNGDDGLAILHRSPSIA